MLGKSQLSDGYLVIPFRRPTPTPQCCKRHCRFLRNIFLLSISESKIMGPHSGKAILKSVSRAIESRKESEIRISALGDIDLQNLASSPFCRPPYLRIQSADSVETR